MKVGDIYTRRAGVTIVQFAEVVAATSKTVTIVRLAKHRRFDHGTGYGQPWLSTPDASDVRGEPRRKRVAADGTLAGESGGGRWRKWDGKPIREYPYMD